LGGAIGTGLFFIWRSLREALLGRSQGSGPLAADKVTEKRHAAAEERKRSRQGRSGNIKRGNIKRTASDIARSANQAITQE
jgi:hypothetical protein